MKTATRDGTSARERRSDPKDAERAEALPLVPAGKANINPMSAQNEDDIDENVVSHEPLFVALSGNEGEALQMDLYAKAMLSFREQWSMSLISDDFAFQGALRWLSAMYHYLGGVNFARALAVDIDVSESTVSRWLTGQTAPVYRIRVKALQAAEVKLRALETMRRKGTRLRDVLLIMAAK